MNKKPTRKLKYPELLRLGIQILFFVLFPSVWSASFAGVRYLFTQMGAGERIECSALVVTLIVLCAYSILFGRFFCGYACAFGAIGDWLYMIRSRIVPKKRRKNACSSLTWIRYIILAAVIVLCVSGRYGALEGWSPWDVFSRLRAGDLHLAGYTVGIVLLLLILAGMLWEERFFCRVLCPMGAVFSLLPVLPWSSLHRDRGNCIHGCSACTRKCPMDVELPNLKSWKVSGDCIQCGTCIGICPRKHIRCGARSIRGNELWFTGLRVCLLLAICFYLG